MCPQGGVLTGWVLGNWGWVELSKAEEPVDRLWTVTVVELISGTMVGRKPASKS